MQRNQRPDPNEPDRNEPREMADEAPFDPWETEQDEDERRHDPLRGPGARREPHIEEME